MNMPCRRRSQCELSRGPGQDVLVEKNSQILEVPFNGALRAKREARGYTKHILNFCVARVSANTSSALVTGRAPWVGETTGVQSARLMQFGQWEAREVTGRPTADHTVRFSADVHSRGFG